MYVSAALVSIWLSHAYLCRLARSSTVSRSFRVVCAGAFKPGDVIENYDTSNTKDENLAAIHSFLLQSALRYLNTAALDLDFDFVEPVASPVC